MKDSPGDQLLELCGSAQSEVILVAPFVKVSALNRILEVIPENVPVTCVARWRPEEIAAGVCDLEIFELIENRGASQLLLHPFLHAKYFRADGERLIGSANLTLRALGWTNPSNLELSIIPEGCDEYLEEFERELYASTFRATQKIRDEMFASVEKLEKKGNQPSVMLSEEAVADGASSAPEVSPNWIPTCPDPKKLYRVYSGRGTDTIVTFQLKAAEVDLKALVIPRNLSESTFNGFVLASLRQMPLVRAILRAAALDPVTREQGERLILEHFEEITLTYALKDHWDIVRNWIVHFLDDHRSSNGSLQKGKRL